MLRERGDRVLEDALTVAPRVGPQAARLGSLVGLDCGHAPNGSAPG